MTIDEIIQEVYEEAISCEYPRSKERSAAVARLAKMIPEGKDIYNLCPQEGELEEIRGDIKPLTPTMDIHYFLEQLDPLGADIIVLRHVLEHSIMPYVLMKLLASHSDTLIVVVPENTKEMIDYDNHYSVMDGVQFRNIANKAGWKVDFLDHGVFQKTGTRELIYLCTQ